MMRAGRDYLTKDAKPEPAKQRRPGPKPKTAAALKRAKKKPKAEV